MIDILAQRLLGAHVAGGPEQLSQLRPLEILGDVAPGRLLGGGKHEDAGTPAQLGCAIAICAQPLARVADERGCRERVDVYDYRVRGAGPVAAAAVPAQRSLGIAVVVGQQRGK